MGKTERDRCALLAEIGFFSGCVSMAYKPRLLTKVFAPIEEPGPGHRQLGRPGSSSLPV